MNLFFLQLPFPALNHDTLRRFIPLSIAQLQAAVLIEGLDVELNALDPLTMGLAGDAWLTAEIVSKRPDILAMTLYHWNLKRSLGLAERVKQELPELVVLVGGPEVDAGNELLFSHPAVTAGCLGEGEDVIVDVIRTLSAGRGIEDVAGILLPRNGRGVLTAPRGHVKDLNRVPSPYQLGLLRPGSSKVAFMETMRGCPFRCAYCRWSSRPVGFFPRQRTIDEIKLFRKLGVEKVWLLDGNFVTQPDVDNLIREMGQAAEGDLQFVCSLSARYITPEKARLLAEMRLTHAIIGLQTVNPAALVAIERRNELDEIVRGCHLLMEQGIPLEVSIILGLPGDTLDDFQATLDFIDKNNLRQGNLVAAHRLSLFPGTSLRTAAPDYGLEYDPEPPYFIQRSDYMNDADLETAIRSVMGRTRSPLPERLGRHMGTGLTETSSIGTLDEADLLDIVTIDLDDASMDRTRAAQRGQWLASRAAWRLTVWFKADDMEKCQESMLAFLGPLAKANPYMLLALVLETQRPFSPKVLDRLRRGLDLQGRLIGVHTVDAAPVFTVVLPAVHPESFPEVWRRDLSDQASLLWSLDLTDDWLRVAEQALDDNHSVGLLADIPHESMNQIAPASWMLAAVACRHDKEFHFRNLKLEHARDILSESVDGMNLVNPLHVETILHFDAGWNPKMVLKPTTRTRQDLKAFQVLLKKHRGPRLTQADGA